MHGLWPEIRRAGVAYGVLCVSREFEAERSNPGSEPENQRTMKDQSESTTDDTELASDALLCRLRDLRKKKREIDAQISETNAALDMAKKREIEEKEASQSKRNLEIISAVLDGSPMSHVGKTYNLSTTRIREILHKHCKKVNSEGYKTGCREWFNGRYTELLDPEIKWIRENAKLFRHNVQVESPASEGGGDKQRKETK